MIPRACRIMIIAHISDTHIALDAADAEQRTRDLALTIADINALDPLPDAIVHTGDIVHNRRREEYAQAAALLSQARAPVYVLPGNKDDRANLREAFSAGGYLLPGSEFIAYAVDGATRMQRLIHDLLAYSRVSTRGREFEAVSLEAVLMYALDNLKKAVEESGAVVTHTTLPTVMGDERQLVQLFQNLLSNAVKFRGEQPPRIHLSAKVADGAWLISVRDNGIGVEPQFAERIFVIFQRLHNREEYPGTGIGLAICKKIVERHGGRIWVESELGKGATFCFTIPTVPMLDSGHRSSL